MSSSRASLLIIFVGSLVLVESFAPCLEAFVFHSNQLHTDMNRRHFIGSTLLSLTTSSFLVASKSVYAKPTKTTAEETVLAWKELVTARDLLQTTDALVAKKDWSAILELLGKDIFKNMEVNGPVLNQDDKKTIGTRKRYGIAADVLFGIGGVQSAIAALSDPQLQSCSAGVCSGKFIEADVEVPKSLKSLSASLSEILTICKSYKEFN